LSLSVFAAVTIRNFSPSEALLPGLLEEYRPVAHVHHPMAKVTAQSYCAFGLRAMIERQVAHDQQEDRGKDEFKHDRQFT